jgi:hypothetical protein
VRNLVIAGLISLVSMCSPQLAPAHDDWAGMDPAMADWYRSARLTDAAAKRLHLYSCCAHADG